MSSQDEEVLIDALDTSVALLQSKLDGVAEAAAAIRPSPGRWSVLDNLEHIAIVDERFRQRIASSPVTAQSRENKEREREILESIPARMTRFPAPEAVHPQGRYPSIEYAFAGVVAGVEKDREMVRQRCAELRFVAVEHPVMGTISGFDAVLLLAAHIRRHANQIQEVKEELQASA